MTVPELRFSEFDKDWRLTSLGEMLSFKNGLNSSKEKYGSGVKLINVLDIIENDYITHEKIIGSVEASKKEIKKNRVHFGDILFQRSSETREDVGQANVYLDKTEEDVVFGGFVIRGRAKVEYSPLFMNSLLKTSKARNEITSKSGGSTRFNVGQDILSEVEILVPEKDEQQKIASFLSAVDRKIEQLTRKKELLEEYKKGVMQKLFTYKLRLGKSELREGRLGDFGYFYYGKGAPKPTIQPHGKTPCVRYGELYSTYGDEIKKVKSKTIVPPEELKLSKGGEVLVPRVGEDAKDFANCSYLRFKDVAIGEMISVYNTEEDGLFMTYYINASKAKDLARRVEGGNVSNLYYKYVEEINVLIPSIEEQRLIVKFVKAIDLKIEAVGLQIEKTQTFKKGLLQKMFV